MCQMYFKWFSFGDETKSKQKYDKRNKNLRQSSDADENWEKGIYRAFEVGCLTRNKCDKYWIYFFTTS